MTPRMRSLLLHVKANDGEAVRGFNFPASAVWAAIDAGHIRVSGWSDLQYLDMPLSLTGAGELAIRGDA